MTFRAFSTTSTGWDDGRPASTEKLAQAGISLVEPGCPERPSEWAVEAQSREEALSKLESFRITIPDEKEYCFSGHYGVYEA